MFPSQILARSYLSELAKENVVMHEISVNDSRSTFVEKLPSYVDNLPIVSNVNYATLRRFQVNFISSLGQWFSWNCIDFLFNILLWLFLQELIWSQKLDEESAKEIIDSISNINLKLNVMAMLNDPEFAKDLVEHKCFDALLPYAKVRINSDGSKLIIFFLSSHSICSSIRRVHSTVSRNGEISSVLFSKKYVNRMTAKKIQDNTKKYLKVDILMKAFKIGGGFRGLTLVKRYTDHLCPARTLLSFSSL